MLVNHSFHCYHGFMMRIACIVAGVLLTLAGCSGVNPQSSTTFSAPPVPGDTIEMTPSLTTPSIWGMENLIDRAKQDLAQQLSLPVDQISLIEASAVVWPDSSMGCPQPGMQYLQVPEDGALIILQAAGNTYEYHNGRRGLFLCEKKGKEPTPPQIDLFNLTPQRPDTPSTPDNSIPPGEDK